MENKTPAILIKNSPMLYDFILLGYIYGKEIFSCLMLSGNSSKCREPSNFFGLQVEPFYYMKKILIVDDHPAIRVAVRICLQQQEGFFIVGEVDNGVDALSFFKKHNPDAVIIDIGIPNLDGIEVIKRIRKGNSSTVIIVFSALDSHHSMVRCFQAGASGFISKLDDITELKSAIIKCAADIKFFPKAVIQEAKYANIIDSEDIIHTLSDREISVLRSLCLGKSNKEIAMDMLLSEKTISTYKTRLMMKLNVSNLVELFELVKKRKIF